ncbi:hypothetical protein M233_00465 [Xylella fastidiosa subsp. multiplex Griffin-1]|nr:hypothetical protein M233_00465 [Xylella fastidiosa subsp. multiplex Griffin-1]
MLQPIRVAIHLSCIQMVFGVIYLLLDVIDSEAV